ncbi:putative DNA-binding protein [Lentibacillus salicampi]|uniref:UPF0122 protein E4U82_01630 n=1 Tax=Lentibacillus salicampi TaxID=175306 RepID=A0A4Y9AFJ8_9BACI|nr:putative DNA-binding protein [Lentibacillus salicampi]TFJ94638.1 putative DNA-binding protein [Lentibacillus salicampi]
MLEKTTRVNYLFDFYQPLLTPKQQSYMDMYYREDYSLGEISELLQVTRQAVYDNIRRTETMLESYEKKLRLYDKFQKRAAILEKMDHSAEDSEIKAFIHQLQELE